VNKYSAFSAQFYMNIALCTYLCVLVNIFLFENFDWDIALLHEPLPVMEHSIPEGVSICTTSKA
jgi:hypothetical protein